MQHAPFGDPMLLVLFAVTIAHAAAMQLLSASTSGMASASQSRHLPVEELKRSMHLGMLQAVTTAKKTNAEQLPLVPHPTSVRMLDGEGFTLSAGTILQAVHISDDDLAVSILRQLVKTAPKGSRASSISMDIKPSLNASYQLHVEGNHIDLLGSDAAGIFYGVQTLRQLLETSSNLKLNPMVIVDAPTFGWRGLHLDVARHFFTTDDVKKLLDTMASFKLNRFHWHLTDDQGWRLPVSKYPNLTAKGASYTAEEIRDVVQFAMDRHIQVIPEVDVPGHAAAAIAAYPELGNRGFEAPDGPVTDWGMFHWTLSPTQTTKDFLEAVLDTLADLFPYGSFHMGGDEAPTDQWRQTQPEARATWLLPTSFSGNVQSVFNQWLGEMLDARGKRLAGWDEMQSMGSVPPNTTIFAWRSSNELEKAVRAGRSTVCSDNGFTYFDYIQGPSWTEPKGQPVVVKLQTVYERCRAFASKWAGEPLVLGGQGQLWSEYIETAEHLEYMAFPRALALADCLWSSDAGGDFNQFTQRLKPQLDGLKQKRVNFHEV